MDSIFSLLREGFKIFGLGLPILLLAIVIYRLKFHPLAKYPGPLLGKITDLYLLYYQIPGDVHLQFDILNKRHGPVVRVTPDRLIFTTPTALRDIYTSQDVQKHKGYPATSATLGKTNIFSDVDKDVHKVKRRALNSAFSEQYLRRFEPHILEQANIFVRQILPGAIGDSKTQGDEPWSPIRDIGLQCSYFALDVTALFSFGAEYRTQTESSNRGAIGAARAGLVGLGYWYEFPWTRILPLHKWTKPKGPWTLVEYWIFMQKQVQARLAQHKDAKADLFAFMTSDVKNWETAKVFADMEDLAIESRAFLFAGTDTTSNALASSFFYLSRNPGCCARLVTELRQTFRRDDDIRPGTALNSCHYLRAVLDESMRMTPPGGKVGWREVGEKGVTVDGEFIPPGAEIGVPNYALFHSPTVFTDPNTFAPERWLESSPYAHELSQARAAFKPFSLGTRNCIGKNLAMIEMLVLLAKVVWNCEILVPDGPEAKIGAGSPDRRKGRRNVMEFQQQSMVAPLSDGPFLRFRKRVV